METPVTPSESTPHQLPAPPAATDTAYAYVHNWNLLHPLTLNRHTNQILDQASVIRAMDHGATWDELYQIARWLGESGQITHYPRPHLWFKTNHAGVLILDQIRLEMAAWAKRERRESLADRQARLKKELAR